MGTVYLARHLQTGGECAIKLLPPGADPELVVRFQREGEAQARVDDHPHVLKVHGAGSERGRSFLVLELAAGGDLEQRLEDGPLEPRAAAALVAQLARGVAHVHARGVLHRDLKPQNVLFTGDGRPVLTDFGLAQLTGGKSLTQPGELLGTPAYMAPEQVASRETDERTDIYGLGALLFHVLTGRPPYQGRSAVQVLYQIAAGKPAPAPSSLRAGIPPELDRIVARAMAPDPAQRYPYAVALAGDLERVASGEGLDSSPRRNLRAKLLGLALLAALGLLSFGWVRATLGAGREAAPSSPSPGPAPPTRTPAPPATATPEASPSPSPTPELGLEELIEAARAAAQKLVDDQAQEDLDRRPANLLQALDWLERGSVSPAFAADAVAQALGRRDPRWNRLRYLLVAQGLESGQRDAYFLEGRRLKNADDLRAAAEFFELAVAGGHSGAHADLGRLLLRDEVFPDVPREQRERRAFELFDKVAGGPTQVLADLAECYLRGWGTPRDVARALRIVATRPVNEEERQETREDFYPRCEDALAAAEFDAEESALIREWLARNPLPSE